MYRWFLACVLLVGGQADDAEPPKMPAPVVAIEDQQQAAGEESENKLEPQLGKLLDELSTPRQPNAKDAQNGRDRTLPSPFLDSQTSEVLDDLRIRQQQRHQATKLSAVAHYRAAVEAQRSGRSVIAKEQIQIAYRIDPQNPRIAALHERLIGTAVKRSWSEQELRAKARLAAALTMAQRHADSGNWRQATDLWLAIDRAAELFPDPQRVELLRAAAKRQLALAPDRRADTGQLPAAPNGPTTVVGSSRAVVETRLTVDYRRVSLVEIVEDLTTKTEGNVVIDPVLLAEPAPLTATIDLRAERVTVAGILTLACENAGVDWIAFPNAVVVTQAAKRQQAQSRWIESRQAPTLARTLFPGLAADLLLGPEQAQSAEDTGDAVPEFLNSGATLVEHVGTLLREAQ